VTAAVAAWFVSHVQEDEIDNQGGPAKNTLLFVRFMNKRSG
jgi:hypothetical protein